MQYDDFSDEPFFSTPEQLAAWLQHLLAQPVQQSPLHARLYGLYAQYVAGELSWEDLCLLRDAPMHLPR